MIITIRRAKLEDYEALMKLYNGFVGGDRYSKGDQDSFKKVLNSTSNKIYVAEDEGKLIGFIAFSKRDVVRYPKPILELDELFIAITYQKHGVGSRLMDQMEQDAKTMNCHAIFIESAYQHKPAHKFYEKLGYENYGYHFKKVL